MAVCMAINLLSAKYICEQSYNQHKENLSSSPEVLLLGVGEIY